jgi:hypothetical protein
MAAGPSNGAGVRPVPEEQRCVWPGCGRRRAPGRASGSGRQKEYCLRADPPEDGGGPVHNARNRWAALRGAGHQADQGDQGDAGHAEEEMGGEEQAGPVPPSLPFSFAKQRASALLEQARRQHAAAIAGLRAERELYERLGQQLTVLADPASLDLEIAAVTSRAGRDVAQAAEEAARARGTQLAAERDRDDAIALRAHADAAAEQLAADAEAAEHALATRTAEFERDREALLARATGAEERAAAAAVTVADAARSASQAREQAREEISAVQARADDLAAQARRQAEELVTEARRDADAARDYAAREREAAQRARAEAARTRKELTRKLDDARQRMAVARTDAAAANARAGASAAQEQRLAAEIDRLRDESGRRDTEHAAELARLDSAHRTALKAERARTARAKAGLDAMRGETRPR